MVWLGRVFSWLRPTWTLFSFGDGSLLPVSQALRQSFLQINLHLSTRSVVDWASFFQNVFESEPCCTSMKLNSHGRVIEVLEAKLGKGKNSKGYAIKGQWVVVGIDWTKGDTVVVSVAVRNRQTLIVVVWKWVQPGTIVITDNWTVYQTLTIYDFHHLTVNHSKTFVDTNCGAHIYNWTPLVRGLCQIAPVYGMFC